MTLVRSCMFLLFLPLLTAVASPLEEKGLALDAPLPIDERVVIKKLDNGLTMYLQKNSKPENRVELRLVINAGSAQEDDDQQGLAHLIEHMAFNGTTHFKKQELVDYIESIGMSFGPDLNAYTSFDETVYMLQVPTDKDDILEKGFLILSDWASGITMDPEEVDKERGVVIEEWRSSRGAQERIQNKQFPILFHKSRYAERLPIGKVEVIEKAPVSALKRYYEKWYRPDLMAVVVVGDLDMDRAEALIRKNFEKIVRPATAPDRPDWPVPDHEETLFSIETDPELTRSEVEIIYKHPALKVNTIADFRAALVRNLYQGLLNQRLNERILDANPPYISAYSYLASYLRTRRFFVQGARVKENAFAEGLEALLLEARRVKRDGFTQSELERLKLELLRDLEQTFRERDKSYSSGYASGYVSHFLTQSPTPGEENMLKLARAFVPAITLDEVNRVADGWITKENRVILISAPQKEGLTVPDAEAVLALMKASEKKEIEAYKDDVPDEPLLKEKPKPGKVVSEKKQEKLGVWEWTLANGIRVVLKPTDFQNDEIRFTSYSPGGTSLADEAIYIPAFTADSLMMQSGVARFDFIQLQKKLAGRVVNVGATISELDEGIGGSASPQDLETALQLLYLYAVHPRADETALQSLKTRWKAYLENRSADPGSVFSDEMRRVLYKNHPRRQPITVETLEKLDLDASLKFYRERFADYGESLFFFVGNFEVEKIKPLIETYIGGLPATGRNETWRDIGVEFLAGKHRVDVRKGLEPKSNVVMVYSGEATWNLENRYALNSAIGVLQIRLREILREDKSGVYGVNISGYLVDEPAQRYRCSVSFSCSPDNVATLIEAVETELKAIAENGIGEDYLTKVRETQVRSHEVNLERNGYWLRSLLFYYRRGIDPHRIYDRPKQVETLSSDMVKNAIKRYFDPGNLVIGTLNPEKETAAE